MSTNWVQEVGIVKPYQEVYGASDWGKTMVEKEVLNRFHKMFSFVPIEGYGAKLSQREYAGLPINWHESIRAKTILSHTNAIILIEDLHDIVTKANARTLRRLINGYGRKQGCLTIDVVQSRDFAGYRLPPVPFRVLFVEPFKFWLKFGNRAEGEYDVSGYNFDKGVNAIVECTFDRNRPLERSKELLWQSGRKRREDSFLNRCRVEFKKGKHPAEIAKEWGIATNSWEYQKICQYGSRGNVGQHQVEKLLEAK